MGFEFSLKNYESECDSGEYSFSELLALLVRDASLQHERMVAKVLVQETGNDSLIIECFNQMSLPTLCSIFERQQ